MSHPLPTPDSVATRVLVLFAHPALEKSRVHRQLAAAIRDRARRHVPRPLRGLPGLRRRRAARAGSCSLAHDVVVVQHPFYWYSTPALVKQWEDLVLEHGWAYGTGGTALRGKQWLSAITTGGREDGLPARTASTASRSASCSRRSNRPPACAAWTSCRPSSCTARIVSTTRHRAGGPRLPPRRRGPARPATRPGRGAAAAPAQRRPRRDRADLRPEMHAEGFFAQAFVYLAAAVVAVPIAKRLGLGSVLGYLLAGVAIGPFGLGFVGSEGQDVMHFAEFGVVMMLFLVGLELEPTLLWRLRTPHPGPGRPAGRRHRRPRGGSGRGARARLAGRPRDRPDARHVVDRDRPPDPERKGAAEDRGRAERPSRCCCSRTSPSSRSSRSFRCSPRLAPATAATRTRTTWIDGLPALGPDAGRARGGRGGRPGGPLPAAAGLPRHRAHAPARALHRGRAAARHRHRAADDQGRAQPGARHLPRRRRARQQRVPPRARKRHRAVQGPAARPVLHRRRRADRLPPHGRHPGQHRRRSSPPSCWRSSSCSRASACCSAWARTRRCCFAFALSQVGEFAFVLLSFATQQGVLGERGRRRRSWPPSRSRWR